MPRPRVSNGALYGQDYNTLKVNVSLINPCNPLLCNNLSLLRLNVLRLGLFMRMTLLVLSTMKSIGEIVLCSRVFIKIID